MVHSKRYMNMMVIFRGGVKLGINNCIVKVSAMQLNKKNIEIVYKVI